MSICMSRPSAVRRSSSENAGRGIDPVARQVATRVVAVDAILAVEDLAHLREVEAEVSEHAGVLRALAGEDEDDLPLPAERLRLVVDARDVLDATAVRLLQLRDRPVELRREIVERRRDDGKPKAVVGTPFAAVERVGEVGEAVCGLGIAHPLRELRRLLDEG